MKELEEARKVFDQLMEKKKLAEDVCAEKVLDTIRRRVCHHQNSMREKLSRTATLWIQYIEMVDELCTFIKAERLGSWKLHLKALSMMLPYLAASCHNFHVKCARVYL